MRDDLLAQTLERALERLGYDELDALTQEQCRVLVWRTAQFVDLGFGEDESIALAKGPVDLGRARTLMAAGCSPETASRILL
jgi:hypothetical protein